MPGFAAAGSQRRFCAAVTAVAALAAVLSSAWTGAALSNEAAPAGSTLYLVTLEGGAASNHAGPADAAYRDTLRLRQDRVLAAVGAPAPIYRWTTALDGFAVQLTPTQAHDIVAVPGVDSVEPNAVRRLAAAPSSAGASAAVAEPATRRRRCRDRTGRLRSRPGQPRLCHGSGPGQRRARILRHLRGGRGLARQRMLQQTRRRALVRRRLRLGQPPQHLFAVPP